MRHDYDGHAARLDDGLQNSRLLPVVKELRAEGILASVETYEPAVAKACLAAGANVLNLTGTKGTDEMCRMVAAYDAAVILCHVQGPNVREVGDFDFTADPTAMMYEYFARQIEVATRCGASKILIDPGLGFGKTVEQNLELIRRTGELTLLGYPVLSGVSRKSFSGRAAGLASSNPRERLVPSIALSVAHMLAGASIFRVHDVSPHVQALRAAAAAARG